MVKEDKRIKQFKRVNQTLSLLLIISALTLGYLWADRQGWLTPPTQEATPPPQEINYNQVDETKGIELAQKSESRLSQPLGQTLRRNLSYHSLTPDSVDKETVSDLAWAAQGLISLWGDRTTPSYKSQYPLKLWLWVKESDDLPLGIYTYDPLSHSLTSQNASKAAEKILINQPPSVDAAPLLLALSVKQKDLNTPAWIEAGQVAENVFLTANNLNLGTTMVLNLDESWSRVWGLNPDERLLWLMPVGKIKETQTGTRNTNPTKQLE